MIAPWRRRALARRFTLIELLIALGIIILLTAILIMGLMGSKTKAQIRGTKGLIQKVKTAMQMYHAEFRDYPPDGYDDEPPPLGVGTIGWTYNAQGVVVGSPPRGVKGTASLLYFLCRPLIKITVLGADATDPRNIQRKMVGPFMTVDPGDVTKDTFNANQPWNDNTFWVTQGHINTELKDKFNRPLCYDKVKSYNPADPAGTRNVYFQPNRFHVRGGGSGTLPRGVGHFVHPDQDFVQNSMPLMEDDEPGCPNVGSGGGQDHSAGFTFSPANCLAIHTDPRFRSGATTLASDGCPLPTINGFVPGSDTSHSPQAQGGGYDLWSYGVSYVNCRDDICSWKD